LFCAKNDLEVKEKKRVFKFLLKVILRGKISIPSKIRVFLKLHIFYIFVILINLCDKKLNHFKKGFVTG
jgi:hypothetical protein